MGFLIQLRSEKGGSFGRDGVTNDQCCCHSAPDSIHCLIVEIWVAVSFLPESDGGIRSSGSTVVMRRKSSLFADSPATTF